MPIIYEPKGRAREYSPYALNIYLSCSHECRYCYAPRIMRSGERYFKKPEPRKNICSRLYEELDRNPPKKQVLLSFIGDPYCDALDDNIATGICLSLLLAYGVPTAILSKGGRRTLKDVDTFKLFGEHIQVGTTLTFDNDEDSLEWERGAAPISERIEVLKELHSLGIKTFASIEPVIYPEQSINAIKQTLDCVDTYKVGKLNNYKLDEKPDYESFLDSVVGVLRGANKDFYVKKDLRDVAPKIALSDREKDADAHCVTW